MAVNRSRFAELLVLVRALLTEEVVDPLVGRCGGACFLIYAAAGQRATDGHALRAGHDMLAELARHTRHADRRAQGAGECRRAARGGSLIVAALRRVLRYLWAP